VRTKEVTVTAYDPGWRNDFENIRRELALAVGDLAVRIEHVGSTSVPGLRAKPCIDIDIVIRDETPLEDVVQALNEIGYTHEGDLGIPGREAFRYSGKEHLKKHHLYVCPESSTELQRHLTFRDYLRTHPQAASRYSAVKEEAARLYPEDIDGYIAHKSPCITALYRECGMIP